MANNKTTQEEIDNIVQLYNKYGTYAEVARQVGKAPPTIKKILEEQKRVKQLTYCGPPPLELDDKIDFSYNVVIENFYKEIMEKGNGIL